MKKIAFIILSLAVLALLAAGAWKAALLAALLLACWLAWETRKRQRPRFLASAKFREQSFDLEFDLFAMAASPQGDRLLFILADGRARLLEPGPPRRLLWETRLEGKPLALALGNGDRAFLAFEKEIAVLDAQGRVEARQPFAPPEQGAQAYRLHVSRDGGVLVLHTPWFVQAFDAGLKPLGGRLGFKEAGNFIKYLKLAPDGSSVFLGGALMLEDGAGVQARFALWQRDAEGFRLAWQKEDDSQDNSHIRALEASQDFSRLAALTYRSQYEFVILDRQGGEVWRRQGEDPALSPAGDLVLWSNPFEGLVLTDLQTKAKLWSRKIESKVRLKQVDASGQSLIVEGRRLYKLDRQGAVVAEDAFATDPHDLLLSQDAGLMAVLRQRHCGLIRMRP